MVRKLLGDTVKEERTRRKLSQNTLAEKAHVSLRTISDIENYRGNPQFETLCALISYLNISIDSIIYDKDHDKDSSISQIMIELEQCSADERRVALSTLHGLLSGLNSKS